MNYNKIQLAGNVGKDAELFHNSNRTARTTFSIAVSEKYKDEKKTTWFDIVCFGKNAEFAEKYIKKGVNVFIDGKLTIQEYEKDGEKQRYTSIIADRFNLISRLEKKENSCNSDENEENDDLPF